MNSVPHLLTGPVAPDSAGMKLMAAVEHLKDICSNTVSKLLSTIPPLHLQPHPPSLSFSFLSQLHTHTHTHTHTQVGDALTTVGEHKKALNQAEKIEQEFITLMTGQKQGKEKLEEHEERHLVATLTPYTVHIASFPACRLGMRLDSVHQPQPHSIHDAYC